MIPRDDKALEQALTLHRRGELKKAASLYRSALSRNAQSVKAIHGLGLIAYQERRYPEAIEMLAKAVACDPANPHYLNHLGEAWRVSGDAGKALTLFREALAIRPEFPEALNNLGLACRALGDLRNAELYLRAAVRLRPEYADAINNLGVLCQLQSKNEDALRLFKSAVHLSPKNRDFLFNLGIGYEKVGQLPQAIGIIESLSSDKPPLKVVQVLARILVAAGRARHAVERLQREVDRVPGQPQLQFLLGIALQSDRQYARAAEVYEAAMLHPEVALLAANNLGGVYRLLHQNDAAMDAYRRATAIDPIRPEPWNNLGVLEQERGNISVAIGLYEKAIGLSSVNAEAHNNLGNAWLLMGEVSQAIAYFERAIMLNPGYHAAESNRLMALLYSDERSPAEVIAAHLEWGARVVLPTPLVSTERLPPPGRPKRIGVLSGDFRRHPVQQFFETALCDPGASGVEYWAYADVQKPDEDTVRLQRKFQHWTDITAMSDREVACRIRDDEIDVLVELGGHTSGSRLLVCAFRPAAVQVSYLGYPSITGLRTIDYRITDPVADPAEGEEPRATEKLVRMPTSGWCYTPRDDAIGTEDRDGNPPGQIVFGSFNTLAKLSPTTVRIWGSVLVANPGSILLLKSRFTGDSSVQERIRIRFRQWGVEERIHFLPHCESHAEHLKDYAKIDLALDSFPYNGTTTTCDALWMGVPVLSLVGKSHVSRVSASLLQLVGLADCVANSDEEFVRMATRWAGDPTRRQRFRSELRETMRRSALLDSQRFSSDLAKTLVGLVEKKSGLSRFHLWNG